MDIGTPSHSILGSLGSHGISGWEQERLGYLVGGGIDEGGCTPTSLGTTTGGGRLQSNSGNTGGG